MTSESPLETKNLAFFGTQCTTGHGIGLVFETGDKTVIGQIANLASTASSTSSTLKKEIHLFIKFISVIALSEALLFFCLGFIRGSGALYNFIIAVGVLVSNVPEGVVVAVTI
jgi:sodium/potassium-transporting ATPase subunit alpha